MAGVANIGSDRNWSGSHFDQANWFAFGRLAWNPQLEADTIAREWVKMTFSTDPAVVEPVVAMMMGSREAVVDYMTPLGLHHLMGRGHHYGPAPWVSGGPRADWTSVYYHRADAKGLGFDRSASGSNAVAQYAPAVAAQFGDISTVPEEFLLWFHHVPWDRKMSSGRTLWDELALRYQRGVDWTTRARNEWAALSGEIDAEVHDAVAKKLAIQEHDAKWWRDSSLLYFQTFSKRPLPDGVGKPQHTLGEYKAKPLSGE
jgi:alpha-glucuronidase